MNKVGQTLWRLTRTILGLAVGALVTSFAGVGLIGGLLPGDSEGGSNYLGMALFAAWFVFLFALPVGLIGHAVLYALKRRELIYYAGLGAIGGGSFALMSIFNSAGISNIAIYGIWAGACAAIAWLIRRPDKDVVKTPDLASHF